VSQWPSFRHLPWPESAFPSTGPGWTGRASRGGWCPTPLYHDGAIAVGFRDAVVAGLVGSYELSLLSNRLCGFKDVGPQKKLQLGHYSHEGKLCRVSVWGSLRAHPSCNQSANKAWRWTSS
jgi:hypothetical protein